MDSTQLTVRIVRKAAEALDIVSLELAPVDGQTLPSFSAGSHIDVEVQPGLIRQYSLCNDPHRGAPLPDRRAARSGLPRRFGGRA